MERSWGEELLQHAEHSRRSLSSSVTWLASCQSSDTRACVFVCLFVCVCVCVYVRGCKGGYITAMLLSNCLLLSLVTTMTSVIGISAFCLHCRASTTLLAAFSLPRAAGPMPHKYKHNLSYTSWLQDRTPHISARGAQPICIHIKVTPQKKGRERKRGEEGR